MYVILISYRPDLSRQRIKSVEVLNKSASLKIVLVQVGILVPVYVLSTLHSKLTFFLNSTSKYFKKIGQHSDV